MALPCWRITIGADSSTVRAAWERKLSHEVMTTSSPNVPDCEQRARQGHVALRDALLYEVADDDEKDHVERLQASRAHAPHHARRAKTKTKAAA